MITASKSFRNITAVFTLLIFFSGYTQDLKTSYDQMLANASTWEQYRVIKFEDVEEFGNQINAEMKSNEVLIADLNNQISSLQSQLDTIQYQLSKTQIALKESKSKNDTIGVFGSQMNKSAYHMFVWLLIVIFGVLAVGVYWLYIGSNKSTSRVKKDFNELSKEYEDFKNKSREQQVKIKRELQTAINTIDELKRSGARKA